MKFSQIEYKRYTYFNTVTLNVYINGLHYIHTVLWKVILQYYQRREANTTGNVSPHKSKPEFRRNRDYVRYKHKMEENITF